MERSQKSETIELLKGVFANAGAVIVTHYDGLTVKETEDLRGRLRAAGSSLKMVKNTLAQKALNGAGEGAGHLFTGPVALAYGPDAVNAAKVSAQYAKENEKFKIVGGLMGAQVLDAAGVDALAKLPSLNELRGKLLGLLNAPATRIAGVLAAPGAQIARVLSAHAQQGRDAA